MGQPHRDVIQQQNERTPDRVIFVHVECITISEKGYTQRRHAMSFHVCGVLAGAGCSRDGSHISSCQAWIGEGGTG